METLEFKVTGQTLERVDELGKPQAGAKSYWWARFELDETWQGMRVAASFFDAEGHEDAALLDDLGVCMVPNSMTDGPRFKVQLVGKSGDTMVKTNKVTVRQVMY